MFLLIFCANVKMKLIFCAKRGDSTRNRHLHDFILTQNNSYFYSVLTINRAKFVKYEYGVFYPNIG